MRDEKKIRAANTVRDKLARSLLAAGQGRRAQLVEGWGPLDGNIAFYALHEDITVVEEVRQAWITECRDCVRAKMPELLEKVPSDRARRLARVAVRAVFRTNYFPDVLHFSLSVCKEHGFTPDAFREACDVEIGLAIYNWSQQNSRTTSMAAGDTEEASTVSGLALNGHAGSASDDAESSDVAPAHQLTHPGVPLSTPQMPSNVDICSIAACSGSNLRYDTNRLFNPDPETRRSAVWKLYQAIHRELKSKRRGKPDALELKRLRDDYVTLRCKYPKSRIVDIYWRIRQVNHVEYQIACEDCFNSKRWKVDGTADCFTGAIVGVDAETLRKFIRPYKSAVAMKVR